MPGYYQDLVQSYKEGKQKQHHKGLFGYFADIVGGAITGFVTGGPWGAVAGAGGALVSDVTGSDKAGADAYHVITTLTHKGQQAAAPEKPTAATPGETPPQVPTTADKMKQQQDVTGSNLPTMVDPETGESVTPEEFRKRMLSRGTGKSMAGGY